MGLVRWLDYRRRLHALALPGGLAFSQKYRRALDVSQIDLIPAGQIPFLQCVVDVGANLGEWSIAMAELTKATQIIAVEPVPEIFQELRANTRNYPRIRCIQSAVGEKSGWVTIHVHQLHQLSSVLRIRDEVRPVHGVQQDIAEPVQVPMTSLDESLSDIGEVSLLKIDVQGYEPQVLSGARSVLKRTKMLMLEVTYSSYYQGDQQFGEMDRLITKLSPLQLWGISAPHCSASRRPLWADAVYVLPEIMESAYV